MVGSALSRDARSGPPAAGDESFDAIRRDLRQICTVVVEPDGILFDDGAIRIEAIRAEDEYAGTRATFLAHCGSARLPLQVDMGLGDSVWPRPQPCIYPTLLDFAAPAVLAYPREAVVAEKLEALVVLGDRNSRIKDFFDLHYLASSFEFERATLAEAVRRTFARRATPIPAKPPIGLTPAYWENPSRSAQVRAFARRARLEVPVEPGREFTGLLGAFLMPVLNDLRRGEPGTGIWTPGGPWQPERAGAKDPTATYEAFGQIRKAQLARCLGTRTAMHYLIGSLESGIPALAERHREYVIESLSRGG